ncbi:hypothetical protein [Streptosporangium sp. CA-115845]
MTEGPLAGLRVVELGGMGPVPFRGMVLSELGLSTAEISTLRDEKVVM